MNQKTQLEMNKLIKNASAQLQATPSSAFSLTFNSVRGIFLRADRYHVSRLLDARLPVTTIPSQVAQASCGHQLCPSAQRAFHLHARQRHLLVDMALDLYLHPAAHSLLSAFDPTHQVNAPHPFPEAPLVFPSGPSKRLLDLLCSARSVLGNLYL